MTAPETDRRLVLQGPVRTPDGAGGYQAGWQTRGTLWAAFSPPQLAATTDAGQPSAAPRYRLRLRAAPVGAPRRPVAGERLVEGTRVFDILAVGEGDPGWLTVLVEEEVMR